METDVQEFSTVSLQTVLRILRQGRGLGHSLVVPKKHLTDIFEIDDLLLAKLSLVTKKIAQKMLLVLGANGVLTYSMQVVRIRDKMSYISTIM